MSFYQRKIPVVFVLMFLFQSFVLAEEKGGVLDSYVEFPVVVFVGQIVELTPFSIIFENRYAETKASNSKIQKLMSGYYSSKDPMSLGFGKSLKVVSVINKKMRASFYLDNITTVFADDIQNYMKFLPLYYLLRNNIDQMKFPKGYVDKFKKLSLDYYLTLPMVEKIMKDSWFVGIFRIDPESSKLVYYKSNYYESIDDLFLDYLAKEYLVPQIVKAGMVVSVTKAKIRGHESKWVKDKMGKDEKDEKDSKGKNKFYNERFESTGEGGK